MEYRVYENNGGGVSMIVNDAQGIDHLFVGLEMALNYNGGDGSVREMIAELRHNPAAWKFWDGWDDDAIPEADAISEIIDRDTLIAWGDGELDMRLRYNRIGINGRALLGLTEDED